MLFLILLSILVLQLSATWTPPAAAQGASPVLASDSSESQLSSSSTSDLELQVRTLDRQILLELVKLAEFNVRYQQAVNHHARWRNVVYPMAQEACYANFLGYTLTDLSQRGRGWNSPGVISPTSTKRALSAATVGALLGSTSSMVELVANGAETIRANRAGFSLRNSVSVVQSSVKQVDEMLARRHNLMAEVKFTGTRRELLDLKEELLKYERDRLVFEFRRWCVHARGYAWYKNSFYVINTTVNLCRFSAIQLGFKSFTARKCAGATGPILTSSAFLAGLGPAASSAIGDCMQFYERHCLARKLPVSPLISDEEAKQKFARLGQLLASNEANQLTSELARLREEKIGLDTLIYHEEKKIQRTRLVAGQQSKVMPFAASLGLTSGILTTVGYHAYRKQPLINNRLGLVGDTALVPAEALALAATPAASIVTYLYERDLRSKGEHPDQLLSKRLKDLKTLETIMTELPR